VKPSNARSTRNERTPFDLPLSSRALITPPSGVATRATVSRVAATVTTPMIHSLPAST
jgi:hypothetical protein